MAWVMTRHGARGTRYTGAYRDPDGRTRSAGSFSTRREALRAANREEQKVLVGAWHDNAQGEISFVTTSRRSGCPTSTSRPVRERPTSPT